MATKKARASKTATPPPAPVTLGELFAVPLDDGRWTACQIVALDADGPVVADLHWIGDLAPTLEQLRDVPVLRVDHHAWTGDVSWVHVSSTPPPPSWRSLGCAKAPALGTCNGHSDWGYLGRNIALQARWDALPEPARRAYKATPYPSMQEIELDLGPTKLVTRAHASDVVVSTGDAEVRWSELDRLPRLTEIRYAGSDAALLEHLRARPMIGALGWSAHGRSELDLRGTQLSELSTRVEAPLRLLLPASVRALRVTGDARLLTVVQPGDGQLLSLELHGDFRGAVAGLPALRDLSISLASRVELAPLAAHPGLTHLRVHGEVVEIPDVEHLARLPALRVLQLFHVYRVDVAKLARAAEAWPDLQRVSVDGFRKEDAARWKECFAGVRSVELRGGKTQTYLAANLDNPFRDWADRAPARGRKATAAWRKARTSLVDGLAAQERERVLRAFVATFDAMGDVDTIDREQIAEAFFELSRAAAIPQDLAEVWFDAWRDF